MARRSYFSSLGLGAFLVGCCLLTSCGSPGRLAVGSPAPELAMPLLDGSAWMPSDGPILVNFWATWCLACKVALPELQSLAESGAVSVVGLALDSDAATVAGFAGKHDISYPLALDDGELFDRFDGLAIPHSVLLDSDGQVLGIYRGSVREPDVVDDLNRAAVGAAAGRAGAGR